MPSLNPSVLRETLHSYLDDYAEADFDDEGYFSLLAPVISDALCLCETPFENVPPIVVDVEGFSTSVSAQIQYASDAQIVSYMEHAYLAMEAE